MDLGPRTFDLGLWRSLTLDLGPRTFDLGRWRRKKDRNLDLGDGCRFRRSFWGGPAGGTPHTPLQCLQQVRVLMHEVWEKVPDDVIAVLAPLDALADDRLQAAVR